ncbi:dolichyl-phosphate-mannose--protein mannosyltransferase [Kocuria sp.]|uniref:dolichyl-phosphate-mannose--protein mannosyltransferase n=1 Tax=Kocuria sp. TaxID=1871328 RepID=UPI0026DEBAE2|nr:phospholipid carrier-dependent glycosyltransferase [Kocuria sp.]MDO5617499.1 phospholipid carrier-dependent glycosyltransferase [Kocuria sp.]
MTSSPPAPETTTGAATESSAWTPARQAVDTAQLREKLLPSWPPVATWMWLLPVLPVILGAAMRFWQLSRPQEIAFDETYYVKDGWSLVLSGFEQQWPDGADSGFSSGNVPDPTGDASFVVHPPVGKWLICLGMVLFGPDNAFGWRFFPAVAGTAMIALVVIAALLMFRSPVVAAIAGTLLAVDGLHLTHSRLALLDIFLAFFILLAFVFLLLDRIDGRKRLLKRLTEQSRNSSRNPWTWGPWLGIRWWRIAAGISCGLAVGVKWNALYFVAVLGIMTVLWDIGARRTAGITAWLPAGVLKDGVFAFVSMIPVALVTYVSTWVGWLSTSGGYHRQWAVNNPGEGVQWLPDSLRSLWEYHKAAYAFHVGLDSGHTYMAGPAQWPILGRPTSYFYESFQRGEAGCTASNCSQAILNLGNPVIWWSAIPVMIALLVLVIVWRKWRLDWRILSPMALVAVGWLPWFAYPERTQFYFYALPYLPFMVLLLAAGISMLIPAQDASRLHRWVSWGVIEVWLALVLAVAAYFWPIWTAQVIPYESWHQRMWFPSWI